MAELTLAQYVKQVNITICAQGCRPVPGLLTARKCLSVGDR
jgi:hypothetical protein